MEPDQSINGVVYRPNRLLNHDQVEQVVEAYRAGATIAELAERFGVHRSTIRRQLDRMGVPSREPKRKLSVEQVADLVRRYESGESTYQLSRAYGMAPKNVGRILHREGVSMRAARKYNR